LLNQIMLTENDPAVFNAEIEALTGALESAADVETRNLAKELVRRVLEFHRAGLSKLIAIVDTDPSKKEILANDPIVASLLALHDLSPAVRAPLIQITRPPSDHAAPVEPDLRQQHDGQCDQCGAPLPKEHRHVVDVGTRRLSCSCRACWLLLAADQRPRQQKAVPDRYVRGTNLRLNGTQWNALQIPVDVAFFMGHSAIGRTIAFYPSPAGATESALMLTAWDELVGANPWVRAVAPDVEALLVRKDPEQDGYACFIVPIDACYELVGRIRRHWSGMSGGDAVRAAIDGFFADVTARSGTADAPTGSRP